MDQEALDLLIHQSWGLPIGTSFTRWSTESVSSVFHGIALPYGSKIKECVNEKILESQATGLWSKWRADGIHTYRTNHQIDLNARQKMAAFMLTLPGNTAENEPLSMDQMQTSFYIYAGMIFLASLSLALENLSSSGSKRAGKKQMYNNWIK